ncbi:hypothetical protein, partial [Klebsiella pneumoniae]|uniref:hypothetical protein n=1 Tax=Klebsiella pneumoniae TaxID=573 RepID=UPI003B987825
MNRSLQSFRDVMGASLAGRLPTRFARDQVDAAARLWTASRFDGAQIRERFSSKRLPAKKWGQVHAGGATI